jgi:hypothetical protein
VHDLCLLRMARVGPGGQRQVKQSHFLKRVWRNLTWVERETVQNTDMNLGQSHCFASRAPTLDLWLEITKIRKFVIQGCIWITKF